MKDMGSIDAQVVIKGTIFMVMVATYMVISSGEFIRTTMAHSSQNKTIGRGGMNVYNSGVKHWDYIPYNACVVGMYCIVPLFK